MTETSEAVDATEHATTLAVENLSKSYPARPEPLTVLREVSFEVNAGENLTITGPSGSGKSTLLNIVGGLDRPTGGSVRVGPVDPFRLSERDLAAFRNHTVGFVFQDHHLLPQLTVLENVLLPTLAGDGPTQGQIDRAEELVEAVGLTGRSGHRPAELSGGERQRVAIARALLSDPALLLCDEPTGNLDQATADQITELLVQLHDRTGSIMLVVTHSERMADRLGHRVRIDRDRLVTA